MADLKLNIYNGKTIEKTYVSDEIDIMFGTVEDLLDVIDFDNLNDEKEVVKVVIKTLNNLKPFLKQIFDGLTDDEIKRTKVKELVPLFVDIVKYTMDELKALTVSSTSLENLPAHILAIINNLPFVLQMKNQLLQWSLPLKAINAAACE